MKIVQKLFERYRVIPRTPAALADIQRHSDILKLEGQRESEVLLSCPGVQCACNGAWRRWFVIDRDVVLGAQVSVLS